jgi:tetratricopeptide (TPR) repeat protein
MLELYLELAESLAGLTDKTNAKQQLAHSLTTFANLRKGEMVVMASDAPYIQRVNECFQTIGESSFFDIVTICYQRGLQALATAREAQAVVDFSKAIKLHQQFEEAYYQRGLAQNLLGLPAVAVTDFSRAIELNSQVAETYYHRARAYDELGVENPEQYYPLAIADFETCLKLNPQHPQARHDLGVAQASWKRYHRYHSEVERKKREAEEKRKAAEAKRQAEQAEKERLERETVDVFYSESREDGNLHGV